MLKVHRYDSGVDGKHLLILGAIHGDEICGPVAIAKTIKSFENKELILTRGKVTLVPICNPEAHRLNCRLIEQNLNRYLFPVKKPVNYEDHLKNELCPLLEEADVLLDIHSYRAGGVPFIFVEKHDGKEVPFASKLGPEYLVHGFKNCYKNLDSISNEEATKLSTGTTEYFRMSGGCAVTLECGGHNDPASIIVAEQAIGNALRFLNMIKGNAYSGLSNQIIEIDKVFYKEPGARFVKNWRNFQLIPKDTEIIRYLDKSILSFSEPCFMVMPQREAVVGDEWFYLGHLSVQE